MTSQPNLPVRPGDVLLGKYRIERVLGAGGMGAVVEATHLALEQRVAMKFMLPHVAEREGNSERFLREARVCSKLRTEHVPKVLDFGTINENMPYLVMELLEGQDLAATVRPDALLGFVEVCEIVIQACEALSEAHARGIIHRDIKPANLFVARRADGSPCVKVLDFGIAKQVSDVGALDQQNLTATDAMMGSPFYMSPEQLRSARDVDARSDIWSLGVTLYQALTGKRPYVAENLGSLILCIVETVPTSPSALRPELPIELSNAVLRCLKRNPDDRYPTMGELAQALAPFAPPRCHALLDRIQAHCDPQGERSGERSSFLGQPQAQGRISAAPTPASSGPGMDSAPGSPSFTKTTDAWTGTHSGKRPQTGKWLIAGIALVGVVATAFFFGTKFGVQPSAPVATPSASISPIATMTSAEVVPPPLPASSASAIAAEPIPSAARTAAPVVRKPTASPGSKSGAGSTLPDYGGRK